MLPISKMIHPDRGTTKAILGKMRTSRPSEQWDVVRLPTGYQVVKVTKLPDYMPSAKAAPVVEAEAGQQAAARGGRGDPSARGEVQASALLPEADHHRPPVQSRNRGPDFPVAGDGVDDARNTVVNTQGRSDRP